MRLEGKNLEKYRDAIDGIRYAKQWLDAAKSRKDQKQIAEAEELLQANRDQLKYAKAGKYTEVKTYAA